jgi:hypothetical protein
MDGLKGSDGRSVSPMGRLLYSRWSPGPLSAPNRDASAGSRAITAAPRGSRPDERSAPDAFHDDADRTSIVDPTMKRAMPASHGRAAYTVISAEIPGRADIIEKKKNMTTNALTAAEIIFFI